MKDALGNVQTVLVLGGTSDIAKATVARWAGRRRVQVVLAGRDRAGLDEVAAELAALGTAEVHCVTFDAADPSGHDAVLEQAWGHTGGFDVVLLAFGVLGDQRQAEEDPDAALEVLRVNFLGGASLALRVAQRLRRQGHGSLVVLSSVAAERARTSNFVYGASKAGLDALAQGLHDRLVGEGVHVLVVRPGFVHTRMTRGLKPAPFATDPGTVAAAIDAGVASGAAVVWAPGILRWVMAVLRHLPRPVFRRLPG